MANKKTFLALGISASLATAALTGCSTWGMHHQDERSAGRILDDHTITHTVKNDLRQEPVYKFNGVDVNTFAGIVQLTGFVNTDDQRRRAGQIAKEVPGVAEVQNDIALKPSLAENGSNISESGSRQPRIYSQPYNPDRVTAQEQGAAARQNLKQSNHNANARQQSAQEQEQQRQNQQEENQQQQNNQQQ